VTAPETAPWDKKYLGTVDLIGIVGGMLECTGAQGNPTFLDIIANRKEFQTRGVVEALDTWVAGPFLAVEEGRSNFLDVLLLLSKHGAHRVMVTRKGGDIVNIITQSAVLKYLDGIKAELTDIGSKQIKNTPLGETRPVYSVSIESKAVEAFQMIYEKKVHGVGVVNKSGVLIATVGARDMHMMVLQSDFFASLRQPLRMFFEALNSTNSRVRSPAVRCSPNDTLESLVTRLALTHIHRIFVTDEKGVCIRVVSLGDLLGEYVNDDPERLGKSLFRKVRS
jgi:CBS-domain-containing membrane protein